MNNDRFKFRAWIEADYYDKEDNDRSITLKFDDVDVIHGGYIGFTLDQLKDVLDKTNLTEEEKESVIDNLDANNSTCDDDVYLISWGTVEQWTGATDYNDNPIYAGDIIKVTEFDEDSAFGECFERIEAVCFGGNYDCCFTVFHDGHYNLLCNELDRLSAIIEVEVIGNIHENPEILEIVDDGN